MARLSRLGLLAGVSWLALAGIAEAGPLAPLVAAAATAFGGSIGGALLLAGKQLVVGVALSLIGKAFVKDPEMKKAVHGVQGQVTVGGETPMRVILGRYATQGHLVHPATWGKVDKTPNAYLTRLHLLSVLPGATLARVLVDDRYVTLDAAEDGLLGRPVLEYRKPAKDGKPAKDTLWIKFYDGSQVAADPGMLATLGDAAERPWLEDMIGRGCVLAKVTALYAPKFFPAGLNFETRFELTAIPVYDPRRDTTAGGSGPQRWSDQSTWELSVNPIVLAYNIMRGLWYEGQPIYGVGLPPHRLPLASWAAAMNACDLAIPLAGGGSEPAYRAGLELDLSGEPRDAIAELFKACLGDMAQIAGRFYVRAGAPGPAIFAFSDADLITTEGSDFDPFPGIEDTYNGFSATYPDPDSGWENVDAPAVRSALYLARDGGRPREEQLEFPAAPYGRQVQRILRTMLADSRRFRTHVVTLGPEAIRVGLLATVSWTSPYNGYSDKLFEVRKRVEHANGMVTWVIREWDPDDYGWSPSEELPTSGGYLGREPDTTHPMTGWSVSGEIMTDSLGAPRRPYIRLTWPTTDIEGMVRVGARVRVRHQAAIVYSALGEDFEAGEMPLAGPTILGGVTYQVQGWMVSAEGERTDPTDWMEVTTPEVGLGPADFSPGAVTMALLSEDVIDLIAENSSDGFAYVELATAARDAAIAARNAALEAADDAAGDAAAAATSATTAYSSRTAAEESAAAAAASLVQARTARDSAQGYATAAGSQATTAAGHASAAATAASTATTRRNEAQTARDAAQTAASASNTARSQAEAAVDDAAGYASAAEQSVLQATAQANLAQGRATAAQTAATQASASAAEASTFAGVSAALGAGNMIYSDILGPSSADVGRWMIAEGAAGNIIASANVPPIAVVEARSLRILRAAGSTAVFAAWEGGYRSGSLRGRRIRITGWAETQGAPGADLYLGIVTRDATGARLTASRVLVAPAQQGWTSFDVSFSFGDGHPGVDWRPEAAIAGGDGAVAATRFVYRPRIEIIDETARETAASLSVETTARANADETMARFLVRTQLISGGRRVVTGFGFQSSIGENGTPESEFEILADKFKVVAPPSVSGQPAKTMFAVQNVNGAAQVAIAGTLYADDVLLTRMIRSNQVTRDAWAASASDVDLSGLDGWVTVQSVSITRSAGLSARIDISGSWRGAWQSGDQKLRARVIRAPSTVIAEWPSENVEGRGHIGRFWVDPANISGSQTYRFQIHIPQPRSGLTIEYPAIYVLELMR